MTQENKSKNKLNNYKPIMVLGNPNHGKTNLSAYLARETGFKDLYLLGYPGEIEGFKNLNDLRDLCRIKECCVIIDEIDEIIPLSSRRSGEAIKRVLKFAYHNRIKLIFNTQLSQFVSKMMSALIPCWAVVEMDVFELKNGCKIKRILLDYIKLPGVINKELGMRLEVGKFIWFDDYASAGDNGVCSFPDQGIGKAWHHRDLNIVNKVTEFDKNLQ